MKNLLTGIKVVTIGYNLPAPLAASKIAKFGANVIKIEPPGSDPFQKLCPEWYKEMIEGQHVITVDLKSGNGKKILHSHLANCDLFLTSNRPSSLMRVGLSWDQVHKKYPIMCMVSVVGYPHPDEELPGHDLTYQAKANMLNPPELPRHLLADILGAKDIVQASLSLLLYREMNGAAGHEVVALFTALKDISSSTNYGVTSKLQSQNLRYNLYHTQNGWIALAALEDVFWFKLLNLLGLEERTVVKKDLDNIFRQKSAEEWESWALNNALPLLKVVTV